MCEGPSGDTINTVSGTACQPRHACEFTLQEQPREIDLLYDKLELVPGQELQLCPLTHLRCPVRMAQKDKR